MVEFDQMSFIFQHSLLYGPHTFFIGVAVLPWYRRSRGRGGGGGGGGGVLTPNFGRYVPRQSEKWARAPDRAPRSSVKMWGSGPSLSRRPIERENAGLRTELEPYRAWKCGSLELPGCAWLALWPAANPGRCRTLCIRAKPAVGGDERVELIEM